MRLSGLLLLFVAGTALHAQNDPPDTLHVSTQLVLLDATVEVKKTGSRIPGLALADFILTEDHHPQTLTYLSTDELPLSITLLFDVTESVMPVLHELANGANDVLLHLKPTDEVAVLTISSHTYLLQPFTTDRSLAFAAIRRAADTRQTNDPTFIYNDMVHVVRETALSTIPNSRRVQLWLTDGTANREEDFLSPFGGRNGPKLPNKQDATDALLRSGQVVSELIEKSTITTRSMGQHDRTGDIQAFADLTGGPVVESSAPQVTARLSALIDQIRQRYTVGYKPSDPKPAGTLCHVELKLSDSFFTRHPELRPKDLTVRTRTTYYR
ncbi:VWFA-related domain-containing protein [Granulicella pectinivorans]|uniref:VWFA-related domain-containing protein n=1 Tax=Granulicella pectinivorans TaxID=474950 RepID=A0A1I6LME1_9BACT|nr:VWA domain-containing protein [Granulicella pectinivorans]SFS04579.1 VWFA-related domain-containing protein [Granulicella pectinivorans]